MKKKSPKPTHFIYRKIIVVGEQNSVRLAHIFCEVPWHPPEPKALEKCQVITVRKGDRTR